MELSSKYNPQETQEKWLKFWKDHNVFHAKVNSSKKPFVIVIPPPNVTGILHMGHALNNTLQDILIRYKRMNGFETLWMPGTDHAGIATQNVVEKELAKEGKKRQDLGRAEFTKRLWRWKKQYGDTIIHQLERLGSSCDWSRTRFTMDDEYSDAVNEAFVLLYNKGLIYQGERIINWCPRCHTALSDEEAEHKEKNGKLYYIKYPLSPPNVLIGGPDINGITVATTRPETMLGDVAVAVNPKDERYTKLIGKTLILPLVHREIKIIADDFVAAEFGTGAVKVTPAHDPNDFFIGQRHNLKPINIMHPDARLNEIAGERYNGLDRFEARKKVLADLESEGLLEKIEDHKHAVGHCYRCDTVVEPYLSKQWFIKMKPLAKPALEAVKKGDIKIYPAHWTKVYTNWMEDIHDWCISRQIWWGHRIPVWYCTKCKGAIVSKNKPSVCKHCQATVIPASNSSVIPAKAPPLDPATAGPKAVAGPHAGHSQELGIQNIAQKDLFRQDEDVLDTWFSSWLWPFATLGWPKQNEDLKYFYPTHTLMTASEILFFWVARMIMAGYEFMGKKPFADVLIHGTVRDAKGRKMSKSLGNAIDPLEIIEEYGADALRFSLIINSGKDIFISKEKFEIGRNFANKIWNASRLVLSNVDITLSSPNASIGDPEPSLQINNLDLPSRWILARFFDTLQKVGQYIEQFRYSEAEVLSQDFFWGNYCDWYLELIKAKFSDPHIEKTALFILKNSLKMLHPFIPFVTEEIYSKLNFSVIPAKAPPLDPATAGPKAVAGPHAGHSPMLGIQNTEYECLAKSSWPKLNPSLIDAQADKQMQSIIDTISAIRNIRTQWNIKPATMIDATIIPSDESIQKLLKENTQDITRLARLKNLNICHSRESGSSCRTLADARNPDLSHLKNSATAQVKGTKIFIPLANLVDLDAERARMQYDIQQKKKAAGALEGRLSNPEFTSKAPEDIILKEKERLELLNKEVSALEAVLLELI